MHSSLAAGELSLQNFVMSSKRNGSPRAWEMHSSKRSTFGLWLGSRHEEASTTSRPSPATRSTSASRPTSTSDTPVLALEASSE